MNHVFEFSPEDGGSVFLRNVDKQLNNPEDRTIYILPRTHRNFIEYKNVRYTAIRLLFSYNYLISIIVPRSKNSKPEYQSTSPR
jgi:hypothetical protein